ncbi:MAG TPA: serine hydrolase [Chthoniobacterales bacterium]|jgi:CubicO group peptidase (beta-lactamase class C family)|nr:serine hydrolase [Chthoniobacterales bacterium]
MIQHSLRFAQRSSYNVLLAFLISLTSTFAADIQPGNCARAAAYSEKNRGFSVLVMQDGKTVFEHYANGGGADMRSKIFSGTKSFWGIAALCAVRDGLIKLDDHVADTITEWKNDARKSSITIRQLLNQTDGIEPAPHLHSDSIRDRDAAAIQLPLVAAPGSVFAYGPSHLQVFNEVLRRKLNGRSTISYLSQNVLAPLDLSSLDFKKDGRGNPLPATGFELTAREWARFGELVLGHGNYHGKQIVPANLLSQACNGSSANPSYGLTFWLNRQAPGAREIDYEKELDLKWQRAHWGGICICRAAPPDTVVALGSNYERLFVIPSMNALIVRQGFSAKFSDASFLRLVLGR